MIGDIFQNDFMIKISICDTFELTKRVFSGSGQMPLNTLTRVKKRHLPPRGKDLPRLGVSRGQGYRECDEFCLAGCPPLFLWLFLLFSRESFAEPPRQIRHSACTGRSRSTPRGRARRARCRSSQEFMASTFSGPDLPTSDNFFSGPPGFLAET